MNAGFDRSVKRAKVLIFKVLLFIGFCAGCAVYYWLNRLQAPGFSKAPPAGMLATTSPPVVIPVTVTV